LAPAYSLDHLHQNRAPWDTDTCRKCHATDTTLHRRIPCGGSRKYGVGF